MATKTLDARVDRIEKIFWVVAVLAVIFGISGAWGINALKTAKSEIERLNDKVTNVNKEIDNAKLAIETEKDNQVVDFKTIAKKEISNHLFIAKKEISNHLAIAKEEISEQFKSRVAVNNGTRIKSLGTHANIKLPVKKGDIIYASFVASARDCEFYYRIISTKDGFASPLINRDQVVMDTPIGRHQWHSISATEVFKVHQNGDLELAVRLVGEGLMVKEKMEVFSPTLVAFKVASDG